MAQLPKIEIDLDENGLGTITVDGQQMRGVHSFHIESGKLGNPFEISLVFWADDVRVKRGSDA